MQSEIISSGQESRSFIEIARRAQLVECAIDAIAEFGYSNASMAEIAKRAGVSKGVISYHFAGKRELIEQVVKTVMEKASAVMLPRIYAEHSAAGMLRAYIESNLDFIAAHHNHMLALMNIAVGARDDRKPTSISSWRSSRLSWRWQPCSGPDRSAASSANSRRS